MEFLCRRCNTLFSQKILLIKHLKKLQPCSILNEDIDREKYLNSLVFNKNKFNLTKCIYCNEEFTQNNNRYRHQKCCPNKPTNEVLENIRNINVDPPSAQIPPPIDPKSKYNDKNREDLIDMLIKLESELHEKCQQIIKQEPSSIVNYSNTTNNIDQSVNTHCHNNIVNNIHINNYGAERLDYLQNGLVQRFLEIDLPKLIRDIHYNPNVPENMNFRLRKSQNNDGNDYIEKRFNDLRVKYDLNDGIYQLIIDKAKILETVPKTNAEYLVYENVDDSMDELKKIKNKAIEQEENNIFFDVYYRLHKEEQKEIASDPNSNEPYCYFKSDSESDE